MVNIKEEIINKAFYQFLNRGYHACSLKHLEVATGFTKGAFYYYFKNKEEILQAGIEKYFKIFRQISDSEFQKIRSLHDYIIQMLERKSYCTHELHTQFNFFIIEPLFFQLVMEVSSLFPHFREEIKDISSNRLKQWLEIINRAQRNGEIQDTLDREILARNFLSVSTSMLNLELISPNLGISFKDMRIQFEQYYKLIQR